MRTKSIPQWLRGVAGVALLAASMAAVAADKVHFVQPKDGATVQNPVHVVFGVDGMTVVPAGDTAANTGHHHLIIDGKPTPKGEAVPVDDTHIHYGKGQTETDVTLAPGKHTLTMQFADGLHRSYGPDMSSTITVTVK
jgi:hypothetical protein